MKLSELNAMCARAITASGRGHNPDPVVMIVTRMPSIGGRHMVGVDHVGLGFDWEAGKLLITPSEHLFIRTQEDEIQQLRQQLDGLIWENSNLKRANKK